MSFNLAVMLRESRRAKPDHPLVHISDLTFTYAQVDEISGRVASALLGYEWFAEPATGHSPKPGPK